MSLLSGELWGWFRSGRGVDIADAQHGVAEFVPRLFITNVFEISCMFLVDGILNQWLDVLLNADDLQPSGGIHSGRDVGLSILGCLRATSGLEIRCETYFGGWVEALTM